MLFVNEVIKQSSLLQDYGKALEDADEKVQLANQIYEMVGSLMLFWDTQFHQQILFDNIDSNNNTLYYYYGFGFLETYSTCLQLFFT